MYGRSIKFVSLFSKGSIKTPNKFYHSHCSHMKAWQITDKGTLDNLVLTDVNFPIIKRPTDVLVKTVAASINPLDCAMIGGYGEDVIGYLKWMNTLEEGDADCKTSVFPFIGGRDFCGEVYDVGEDVRNVKIGDKVYGVVSPQRQGSHAEYTTTSSDNVIKLAETLTETEGASVPYAALTAWSTLTVSGGLIPNKAHKTRALVLGASGGVGIYLVQLLTVWGADVVAVCSEESFDLVTSLGVFELFNYKEPDTKEFLTSYPGFDLIIDASGTNDHTYMKGLKQWTGASYITLSPPLLKNTDTSGLVAGAAQSLTNILSKNISSLSEGKLYKWAFFMPNPWALKEINKLLTTQRIRTVIDKTFKFEQTSDAYKHVIEGPSRGKTVISYR